MYAYAQHAQTVYLTLRIRFKKTGNLWISCIFAAFYDPKYWTKLHLTSAVVLQFWHILNSSAITDKMWKNPSHLSVFFPFSFCFCLIHQNLPTLPISSPTSTSLCSPSSPASLPPSLGISLSLPGLQISVTVSLWYLLYEKWRHVGGTFYKTLWTLQTV